jgi:hypothetical protein
MPDGSGKVRGISTSGIKNKWLDEIEKRKETEREAKEQPEPRYPITPYDVVADFHAREGGSFSDAARFLYGD